METPKEVRAWVSRWTIDELATGGSGWLSSRRVMDNDTPVRVLVYDPDPPPEWERGQELRGRQGFVTPKSVKVGSDVFRDINDTWCFIDEFGVARWCHEFEPIPTTQTVTYRITGTPERLAYIAGTLDVAKGITVEVVDDA